MAIAVDRAVLYGGGTNEPTDIIGVAQSGANITSLANAFGEVANLVDRQKSVVGLKGALGQRTVGKLRMVVAFSGATLRAKQGISQRGRGDR